MINNNNIFSLLVAVDTDVRVKTIASKIINFLKLYDVKKVEIDIFHSYELPVISGKIMPYSEAVIIEDEQFTQIEVIQKIRKEIETEVFEHLAKESEINTFLEEGDFIKNITKQIDSKSYDLLVLTPKVRDSFEQFFRKSKVKQLIEKLDIPILVLPKVENLFSKDFKLIGLVKDEDGYNYIKNLTVYNLAKIERKMLAHFGSEFEEEGVFYFDRLPLHSIDETFVKYVKKYEDNNLYIIDHQKRKGIKNFFSRSFTQNFLSSSNMNMIIV